MALSPGASRVLLTFLAGGVMAAGLAAQPGGTERPGKGRQEALERFHRMSPDERLAHVAKNVGVDKAFTPVVRDDLDLTVVERGTVESADAVDIVSRLKDRGTVKLVVDDGTFVKKGDLLVLLDDSALREQLRMQQVAVDLARAARLAAEADLKLARKENELALRGAELNLKVARLDLKRDDAKDAERKEVLQLKVEQAQLALETAKLRGRAIELKAAAELKAKTGAEEQETSRREEIEAQVGRCVIRAPQDGIAVYHVPEGSRFADPAVVLALGETVREGQKLMRVCGLKRFTALARVHEADISRVRAGQVALVRVDAFPKVRLEGRVKAVSPKASPRDWLTRDVRVYPVTVELTDPPRGLKPGMSAEVRIAGPVVAKVLQVPVGSVARIGREAFCYVRVGKELQERKVTLGARSAQSVEIKDGLKEGEEVLRDPGR